jgi:hypothetical protein
MGEEAMKPHFEVDKNTNVAYLDVVEAAENAKIRVIDVSDQVGLRSQVMARVDIENKVVLGLIVEDFTAFSHEVRWKYLAWRVERIAVLLLCSVRNIGALQQATDDHKLAHV